MTCGPHRIQTHSYVAQANTKTPFSCLKLAYTVYKAKSLESILGYKIKDGVVHPTIHFLPLNPCMGFLGLHEPIPTDKAGSNLDKSKCSFIDINLTFFQTHKSLEQQKCDPLESFC